MNNKKRLEGIVKIANVMSEDTSRLDTLAIDEIGVVSPRTRLP
jgi:hypothetical protein